MLGATIDERGQGELVIGRETEDGSNAIIPDHPLAARGIASHIGVAVRHDRNRRSLPDRVDEEDADGDAHAGRGSPHRVIETAS